VFVLELRGTSGVTILASNAAIFGAAARLESTVPIEEAAEKGMI
jgi:hypothetical protein